ncbi:MULTISPECIES: DUF262 domain-containing protein [unclassified Sphingomonas]|uniref:DUF262 domain-containing protein n=1 Tax=Sphingomonas sp. PvP015 TaxID=3156388 RepID=UPI0033910650
MQARARYKVPIYQRSYVWTRDRQWEPLWSDIRTKATERLAGRPQRFSHYMGAVVLESRGGYSARLVPASQIVDGQQRLTTFQLFLAAARDYANMIGHESARQNIERYLLNADPHLMEDPDIELFKVWPPQQNQELFTRIVRDGREALRKHYRAHFYAKRDKIYDYSTTPRMLAAYGYFFDRIREAVQHDALQEELIEPETNDPTLLEAADPDQAIRPEIKLDAIWQALIEEFKVVEIVLEDGDDAQVIFETLNERGEPLLAADLVRNHIFHRAEEEDRKNAEKLFREFWNPFEDGFWAVAEKQGRYKKQRIEFFLANYIAAQISSDVTITKLFSEYKAYLKLAKFPNVEAELRELSRFGAIYRTLIERDPANPLGRFGRRLQLWDLTTVFPLVLQLWSREELDETVKESMLEMLLSFIVRRAVCNLTPKNYNKLFLAAVAELNQNGWSVEQLQGFFARQTADSARWPRDDEFRRHWTTAPAYPRLGPARSRAVLEELERAKRTRFHETDALKTGLTVEHLLPDSWSAHWPFADGSRPSTTDLVQAVYTVAEDASALGKTVRRNRLKHSLGNLTLLTRPLNSLQSNAGWNEKRALLLDPERGSLLVLNKEVTVAGDWNEAAIETRGAALFEVAVVIWPFPVSLP